MSTLTLPRNDAIGLLRWIHLPTRRSVIGQRRYYVNGWDQYWGECRSALTSLRSCFQRWTVVRKRQQNLSQDKESYFHRDRKGDQTRLPFWVKTVKVKCCLILRYSPNQERTGQPQIMHQRTPCKKYLECTVYSNNGTIIVFVGYQASEI